MLDEQNGITLQRDLQQKLNEFQSKVPIWGITLFTVDGYIIADVSNNAFMPDGIDMIMGSMSAGLLTIAEDLIRFIQNGGLFNQVVIDSYSEGSSEFFSILLRKVKDNTLLSCVFPTSTQLGLVTFEIETLCHDIREILSLWDIKVHKDTVT